MYRDTTLDLAKGLLIILEVLGHALQFSLGTEYTASNHFFDDPVFKTIYTFHMPLFMLISGYLFYNSNKKELKTLVPSKLKAIGNPMLSFIFIIRLPSYASLIYHGDIIGACIDFIYTIGWGTTMWFLFSILLNMSIIAILTRAIRNKCCLYAVWLCIIVGSMFVPDTYLLSVHKFMFPFFCIGYVLKENDVPLYTCSKNTIAMVILTVLSVGAICWFDKDTYIYTTGFCIVGGGNYTTQLLIDGKRLIIALIVSFTFMQYVHVFAETKKNSVYNTILRLGQISLFVYGFNIFFDSYYTQVLSYFNVNFGFNYFIPILFAACIIVIAYYSYKLLDRNNVTRILFLGK